MPSEGRGGLSDTDVQRIAKQLAGQMSGRNGEGARGLQLPAHRRGGKGKSKGKGQAGGGGGDGKGGYDRGSNWKCLSCGEPNNYSHRVECFRCYAPRRPKQQHQQHHRPADPQTKPNGKGAKGNLSAPYSGPLRPNVARPSQGPVGADGQRPLFKRYLEDEARKKQRRGLEGEGENGSKDADDNDDGFLLVTRAAGIWPRVGGADTGRGRGDGGYNNVQTEAAAADHGADGGGSARDDRPRAKPTAGPERRTSTTPTEASAPRPAASPHKARTMPSRPSWADQDEDDMCQWEPEQKDTLVEDDWDEPEGDGDEWQHQHHQHHEGWDEDDAGECEGEADTEVLRERWLSRRDILDAVRIKYGKGSPQYDTARREATAAYEAWQEAKRADNAPRLATLHQRRQRALDHAQKMLQKDMDAAEQELARHATAMDAIKERISGRQRKVDEAQERLQEVMQKVGNAATEGCDGGSNLKASQHEGMLYEVRGRARDARENIVQAGTKLQLVLDMLDAEGHHEACQHLSFLFGSITDAAAELDGVERVVSGTTHHAMDADDVIDECPLAEVKPPKAAPTPKRGDGGATGDDKTGKKAKGSGGKGSQARAAGTNESDNAGAARADAARAEAAAAAAAASAAASTAAAAPSFLSDIFYGGATNLAEEEVALRDAASKAVQ